MSDITLRIGEKINTTPKVVVTGKHPLQNIEWGEFKPPTQLTGTNVLEQIAKLKEGEGGDIMMFGSPTLLQSLTNARLIDEYRIVTYPVIVNEGKYLFENLKGQIHFRLIDVTSFERGTILITYAPQPAA